MAIHLDCWMVARILETDFFNKLLTRYRRRALAILALMLTRGCRMSDAGAAPFHTRGGPG